MAELEPVPRLPVAPQRDGLAAGAMTFGLGALVAVVVLSSRPVAVLVLALFFAVFFGVFMWFALRGIADSQRAKISRVTGVAGRDRQSAFLRGIAGAITLVVLETVVLGICVWVWSAESVGHFLPGILLGTGLCVALDVRDLRRWETRNGVELFTRSDARRIAFTNRQALQQQVAVVQEQRDEHASA